MSSTSCSSQGSGPTKDSTFFFSGDLVIFQVENVLFRVPSYRFTEQSDVFRDMFNLPQGEGLSPEGRTEETPIRLDDVTAVVFKSFLVVLYRGDSKSLMHIGMNDISAWVGVLECASKWNFKDIRGEAINMLLLATYNKPTLRISLARRFAIQSWDPFMEMASLVLRNTPLEVEESESLGIATAVAIMHVREELHQARSIMISRRQSEFAHNVFCPYKQDNRNQLGGLPPLCNCASTQSYAVKDTDLDFLKSKGYNVIAALKAKLEHLNITV